MNYNSLYSPNYYLKFLNWLHKNVVYNITSDCNSDRKIYLVVDMDYNKYTFIGECVEECLDNAMNNLNWN